MTGYHNNRTLYKGFFNRTLNDLVDAFKTFRRKPDFFRGDTGEFLFDSKSRSKDKKKVKMENQIMELTVRKNILILKSP